MEKSIICKKRVRFADDVLARERCRSSICRSREMQMDKENISCFLQLQEPEKEDAEVQSMDNSPMIITALTSKITRFRAPKSPGKALKLHKAYVDDDLDVVTMILNPKEEDEDEDGEEQGNTGSSHVRLFDR